MIQGIRFKVCGLTSLVDAEFVDRLGADYLGFILYPKSPRYVSLAQYAAMSKRLPSGRRRVAVMVEPSSEELAAAKAAEFDRFQIHFRHDTPSDRLREWSEAVEPHALWLAPKLPPEKEVDPEWLPLAGTFLLDTFHPDKFGGSGLTSDWAKFASHQKRFTRNKWILSGGLGPRNIAEALTATGARIVDVNSGVESAPGVKDHAKLKAFVLAVARTNALS